MHKTFCAFELSLNDLRRTDHRSSMASHAGSPRGGVKLPPELRPTTPNPIALTRPPSQDHQAAPAKLPGLQLTPDLLAASRAQPYQSTMQRHQQGRHTAKVQKWTQRVPLFVTDKEPRATIHTKRSCDNEVLISWGCKLEDSLPNALKPRFQHASGRKWAHDVAQDKRSLPASSWPKAFRKAVARMARHSKGGREHAHSMLREQVEKRQASGTHPEHYACEALTSDIEAVIAELQARARAPTIGHELPGADAATTMKIASGNESSVLRPQESFSQDGFSTTGGEGVEQPEYIDYDAAFDALPDLENVCPGEVEPAEWVDTAMRRVNGQTLRTQACNALVDEASRRTVLTGEEHPELDQDREGGQASSVEDSLVDA